MSSSLELDDIGLNSTEFLSAFRCCTPIGNVSQHAFSGNAHIEDICISAAESIDNYALSGCYGLTSLDLPGIVDYTSVDIFGDIENRSQFNKLTKITIANGTQRIGTLLAGLPALKQLELPDTLLSVSNNSFAGCKQLCDIKFGHSIILNDNDLSGLNTLSAIEFPILLETATDIGLSKLSSLSYIKVLSDRPFMLKTQLSGWNVPNSVLEFEDYATNLTALSQYSFASCGVSCIDIHKSKLTTVPSYAFKDYVGQIKLPNSIECLEHNCFCGAKPFDLNVLPNIQTVYDTGTQLRTHTLPPNITAIYDSAFRDSHFNSGVVALGNQIHELKPYAFNGSNASHVILHSCTLTSIPIGCFAHSLDLTTVSITGSYQDIAPSAFADCNNLAQIELTNVKHIGAYAFANTSLGIDSATLDLQNVDEIGDNAFQNCTSLKDVVLSREVLSSLGQTIFSSCTALTSITLNATLSEMNDALCARIGRSLIPATSNVDDVKTVYKKLKLIFIGDSAHDPCFILRLTDCSIAYDGSMTKYRFFASTGSRTPYECLNVHNGILCSCDATKSDYGVFCTNPIIPDAVGIIASDAFANSTNLSSVDLSRVQSIGAGAFAHTSLISAALPNSLSSVEDRAFANCSCLTSITIGNTLTSLPGEFITGSFGIDSLRIPANIVELKDNALMSTSDKLQVTFESQSREEIRRMLKDNRVCATPHTTFYGIDNDYKYPMFICANTNSIYEVKNNAFTVNANLELESVDDTLLGYNTIAADMLDGLTKINSLAGISKSMSIILPVNDNKSNIAIGIADNAFDGWNSLERIDIAINYEEFCKSNPQWTPDVWGVVNTAAVHFNDGTLKMTGDTWVFENTTEVFIPITIDGKKTVLRINDQYAQSEEQIPEDFFAIGTGSLSTTLKIKTLSADNICEISANAFTSNQSIKTTYFSNKLSVIAENAFERSCISSFQFPASISTVNACGLNKAYFLKDLAFSNKTGELSGTREIAQSAFINMQAELTSLTFGNRLTSIGDYAFAELESVFPRIDQANFNTAERLTRIGNYAFFNSIRTLSCNTFIAPLYLKEIGDAAFGYHKDTYTQELSALDFPAVGTFTNVVQIGLSAFIRNRFKSITFSEWGGLKSIGDYAFAYPKYKYDLYLPKTIESIGENAFKGNIILNPDAVKKNIISVDTKIGKFTADNDSSVSASIFKVVKNEYAQAFNRAGFTDHTCLSALQSDYYTGFAYIFDNAMHFCPNNLSIDILTRTVINVNTNAITAFVPAYVDVIDAKAFKDCTSLTALSVLNLDTTIEASAFYNCNSLLTINDPSSFMINCAMDYAFYNCQKLHNIQLLSSIERIGDYAFAGCEQLTDVWCSSMNELNVDRFSLSSIGNHAFDGCSNLSVFYIFSNLQQIGDEPFKDCANLQNIWIYLDDSQFKDIVDPNASVEDVIRQKFSSIRTDNGCRINFLNSIYMNDGTVKIDNEYVVLREVNPHDKLSAIEAVRYWSMVNDNQTYLNLSAITEIDPFAFAECTNIKSLNFLADKTKEDARLTVIGDFAFNNCTHLAKINGNELSCVSIGDYAFANCTSLIRMQFNLELLQSLGQGVFYKTNLNELAFNAQSMPITNAVKKLKQIMHYDSSTNKNPLEVPDFCQFTVVASDKIGKYDCLMNDLTYSDIDTCTNQMVFVDKTRDSIKPLLIVKSKDGYLPAIVSNSFHVNVIGRWK